MSIGGQIGKVVLARNSKIMGSNPDVDMTIAFLDA